MDCGPKIEFIPEFQLIGFDKLVEDDELAGMGVKQYVLAKATQKERKKKSLQQQTDLY